MTPYPPKSKETGFVGSSGFLVAIFPTGISCLNNSSSNRLAGRHINDYALSVRCYGIEVKHGNRSYSTIAHFNQLAFPSPQHAVVAWLPPYFAGYFGRKPLLGLGIANANAKQEQ
ncbi:hypothetical protein [Hymenobacter terricola]|uniref:hypothetical protein n=1 Tax=Hymenobacter terricola TaxID=2819236 RepID=UPI001B313FCD|nr:hypothetical protein [Hymenobacter terricola]